MNLQSCFDDGLLKRVKRQPEVALKEIEKAKEYLGKAKKNHSMKIYDLSVVAAYTAMFHAARSLLFKDGIKERSHVCIILYLRSKYHKLAHHIRVLDSYRRFRHTALYALDVSIDENEAREALKSAKEFIDEIEGYFK
jgi:uncharacterized protein (UPF0332 family)